MNLTYIKKAYKSEWLKTKGLGLLPAAVVAGTLLPFLIFIFSIFNENARQYNGPEMSAIQYYTQETMTGFGSFFLLVLIIISATRIAQTDHKNNGWTFMETQPLSKLSIYLGKFLNVITLTIITIISFVVAGIIVGTLMYWLYSPENLILVYPWKWLFHAAARLFVMSLGVASIQMMLAIIIPGFVWPFLIGFIGFVINIVGKVRHETYDPIVYNNVDTSLAFVDPFKLNNFFSYSDYLSIFWMVVFFVIGYQIYSNRGIKNAFLGSAKKILISLVGVAIFTGVYMFLTREIHPSRLEGKTLIEGKIWSENPVKEIHLISDNVKDKIATIPVKDDGSFHWETNNKINFGTYILDFDKRFHKVILADGDHIILTVKQDPKNFRVSEKGTRKAESSFLLDDDRRFSEFFDVVVADKQFIGEPEKFYDKAKREWKESERFLSKYRTKENIYLSDDFKQYKRQQKAVDMLNAIRDYQRMTSLTDAKYAPPADFKNELLKIVEKPTQLLLTDNTYIKYKLDQLAPEEATNNMDSLIISKVSQLPKGFEKDEMLKVQLLKMIEIERDEKQRNVLFTQHVSEFSNPRYAQFVGQQLHVINNQQKGKPFPKLVFKDQQGKKMSLEQFKGKYVLIDLWATWCAPCLEIKPVFEYEAHQYRYNDKMVFLSASIDQEFNKWQLHLKNKKSTVTQWWVANAQELKSIGMTGIPRFIMLDPEGKIYNANMPRPGETNFREILDALYKHQYIQIR